ncbi:MAG: bifunctional precorrin-2 dehydrogenase/sirohydrochlorin ferrochelatase [Flavobacteriales bacterium]
MNQLFPLFLRTDRLHFLIAGGGDVAEEKLQALLRQYPDAHVVVIAEHFETNLVRLAQSHAFVVLRQKAFSASDLNNIQVVLAATRDAAFNLSIVQEARKRNILVNAADMPELCDFYLGAVVKKGNLKIGISTNGSSPILARRLREFFEDVLPDDIDQLINDLYVVRKSLKGDFQGKSKTLSELTASFRCSGGLLQVARNPDNEVWD